MSKSSPVAARTTGEQLRLIRNARRLSLSQVEKLSGGTVKGSVLGAYERDDRAVSVDRAREIAAAYGVSLQELLFATPDTRLVLDEVVA
jgi:transcriptional regulator with XRE-family HTH domain